MKSTFVLFVFLQETTRIPSLKKKKKFLADASVQEHPVFSMQAGPSEPSFGHLEPASSCCSARKRSSSSGLGCKLQTGPEYAERFK